MEKTLSEREQNFKTEVYKQPYPSDILEEFYEYWTEPNKSNTRLRFEMEATWDLGRRLKRWARVRFSRPDYTKREIAQTARPLDKPPQNRMEELQVFFTVYTLRPYMMEFEKFEQWYDFMKTENLLIELKQEDKDLLKLVYGNDGKKLKCAWVQKTMDWYFTNRKDFKRNNFLKAI